MQTFLEEKFISEQTKQLQPKGIIPFVDAPFAPIYTLVARPSQEVREKIRTAGQSLKKIDPHQYFYSPEQYHFTLMGDIPLVHEKEHLIKIFKETLRKNPLNIVYKGIQMNSKSAFVPIYFENDALHKFRTALREIEPSFYNYSSFLQGLDSIAWLNIVRFTRPFSPKLKDKVIQQKDIIFGAEYNLKIELYETTSLVLLPQDSKLVFSF